MPDPVWWAIHAVQEPALMACVFLAVLASRRVGAHTPYGTFLFVVSVGFWFLVVGNLLFVARNAVGLWDGPGGLSDVVTLCGWFILTLAYLLLAIWFPTDDGRIRAALRALGAAALGCVLVLGIAFVVLSRPGQDASWTVRAFFLAADGLGLGALAAGAVRMWRVRQSSLGRLVTFLGVALLLKTVGDLTWVYLAARGLANPWASILYPVAGGLAVVGLVWHYADVQREAFGLRRLDEPWIRTEQRVLRDFIHQVRGLAGGHAARTVLTAAGAPLTTAGMEFTTRNDTLYARASPALWREVLAAATGAAQDVLGQVAQDRLDSVWQAYGEEAPA